jgi:hypothetical protein
MAPLIVQMAEQKLAMQHMTHEIHACAERVATLRKELKEAEEQRERDKKAALERRDSERRETRRHRWTLMSGVLFVVLTTLGGIVVQIVTATP